MKCLKAAGQLSFRVSDAVRHRKAGGARTSGPQAVIYGDFGFGKCWALVSVADNASVELY